MNDPLELMAVAVQHKPHSFQYIRERTGLQLSDAQFTAMARGNPARFRLVRFVKHNDEGARLRPGRPGVGLRKHP